MQSNVDDTPLVSFSSWVELLAWVEFDGVLFYHFSTEMRPTQVRCKRHGQQVEVMPADSGEKTIVGEGHLNFFQHEA